MPNPQKAQVKIETITELGNNLDDLREGAHQETFRLEGYSRAVKDIEEGILSVAKALNLEVKAGEVDDTMSKAIKRYLTRCMGSVDNLKVRNQKAYLVQQGKVQGLQTAVQQAKKMVDAEAQKIPSVEVGAPIDQMDVGRPTMSAAEDIQQRREETRKAKEAKAKAEVTKAEVTKVTKAKKVFRCGFCKKVGHTTRGCSSKKNAVSGRA